ncbi:TPA: hypothetical protein ACH3X1_014134 [Trebouxia sp. C0004]
MGGPKTRITQESFDAAVKDNQEEFGMEVLVFQSAGKVLASVTRALCSKSASLNTLHYSKQSSA